MAAKNFVYARVSSEDQNPDRQKHGYPFELTDDCLFIDRLSGKNADRPALNKLIDKVREGDAVYVQSIDRLARSLIDLHAILGKFRELGTSIHFIKERLNFTAGGEDSANDTLYFNIMGAFAEFERSLIKERQRAGIKLAKAKGVYKGNPSSVDKASVLGMIEKGVQFELIGKAHGISVSTVQRIKRAAARSEQRESVQ